MTAKDFFAKPQVQALLWRAVGSLPRFFCSDHLQALSRPTACRPPDPSLTVLVITTVATEGTEWIIAWYRTNPNNIIRRAVKLINGDGKQITDETKAEVIMAANNMPSVATVVLRDGVNGVIGDLAKSDNHPNIVTETQNEADAKKGTK